MSSLTGGRRLLVIDDEADITENLQFFLQEEGFEVEAVNSGEMAIKLIREQNFSGVVLDWIMPGVSGSEILAEIEKKDHKTPVLVISAAPAHVVTQELGEGRQFLRKPFDIDRFIEQLHTLFNKRDHHD